METAYYSPWPEFIFSGWILAVNNDHVCHTHPRRVHKFTEQIIQIHKQDTLKIQGIVKALGGQVRDKLSPDVTHFISLKEKGVFLTLCFCERMESDDTYSLMQIATV